MTRTGTVQQVLCLYKRILRLHQSLPVEIRILGNEYVKSEFRLHKNANDGEIAVFINEWKHYAAVLTTQLGLPGRTTASQLGLTLNEEQLDSLREDQLRQLVQLMKESIGSEIPKGR